MDGPASHLPYRSVHALTVGMTSCSVRNVGVRFLPHSACGPTAPLSPRCVCVPAELLPPRPMHGPGAHVRLRSVYRHAMNVPSCYDYGATVHRPFVPGKLQT